MLRIVILVLLIANRGIGQDKECIMEIETERNHVRFFVPEDRFLAATNGWNPSLSTFPINIREYSEKARRHLIEGRQIHGKVALSGVRLGLKRRRDQKISTSGQVVYGAMVERWIVQFHFEGDTPGKVLGPVVMLLDGTIAEEQHVQSSLPGSNRPKGTE